MQRHLAALALYLLALGSLAPAQSIYGSISGKVLDPSGAVIPRAAVSVKNTETGLARQTETDDTGFYRVASLNVGPYTVEVAANGFEKMNTPPRA